MNYILRIHTSNTADNQQHAQLQSANKDLFFAKLTYISNPSRSESHFYAILNSVAFTYLHPRVWVQASQAQILLWRCGCSSWACSLATGHAQLKEKPWAEATCSPTYILGNCAPMLLLHSGHWLGEGCPSVQLGGAGPGPGRNSIATGLDTSGSVQLGSLLLVPLQGFFPTF